MPLYEYKCNSCGKTFEKIQKFSDEPLRTHDECGGEVERLFSAPAFHLKGTGWYVTDYARGGTKAGDAKSGESKSGESKTGDSKPAESKPAASESKSSSTPASE